MYDITNLKKLDIKKIDFFQFTYLINHLVFKKKIKVKIKYYASFSLEHPEGEIEAIKFIKNKDGELEIRVDTNFFNIVGTKGVLPSHYTEYIISCKRQKDYMLLDLTNIFYNRMIKSFTNIITKNNFILENKISKSNSINGNASHLERLSYLIGMPSKSNFINKDVPKFLLSYAGLLINRSRPVHVLKSILSHYYKLKIKINQFVEEKIKLECNELSKIGKYNSDLGKSLYLGNNAYFNLNKIEVVFEDLDYKTYKKFIEDKIFTQRLHEILKFYLDKNINYVLTFLVRDPEKVTFINSNSTRRLGLDIWCKS